MKPRNRYEKRVVKLSSQLPKITPTQLNWAYNNCLKHYGVKTKKGVITCLECNHKWSDSSSTEQSTTICPNCKMKIEVTQTRKRVFEQEEYLCIITRKEEFQVLRFIYLESKSKVGETPKSYYSEVVQQWIAPNGKTSTIARLKRGNYYYERWSLYTDLEIRDERNYHNIIPTSVYPRQYFIPEIERSGYNPKERYDTTPYNLFATLLADSRAETLLKTGQKQMFEYITYRNIALLDKYWSAIRICIRNNYTIDDPQIWCDYIDLLLLAQKDTHSPKYVCPQELQKEHDKLMNRRRAFLRKQESERQKKSIEQYEIEYNEEKSQFFGLTISNSEIEIKVLESVKEFYDEAEQMKHCLFTNQYYKRNNSLILSASKEGERLETIEFSLSEMKVIQCRGVHNGTTEYHDDIINLVNQNSKLIESRMSAQ